MALMHLYPDGAARVARAAEAAGFDSLWGGEHIVLPDPRVPSSPFPPEDRIMDPVATLAFLAPGAAWKVCPRRPRVTSARPRSVPWRSASHRARGGEAMDRASAERFAALGVHHLILMPPRSLDAAGLERFVAKTARELR